jgi:hypothetical protein
MAGLLGGGGNGTAVWAYCIVTIQHGKGVAWLVCLGVRTCTVWSEWNALDKVQAEDAVLYIAGRKCFK